MIRLLIVDDEAIERQAMRQILTHGLPEAEVYGEAANGREAIHLADELGPDIILMDIKMPGIDGIQAVKSIKRVHPDIKFVIVSAFDTFGYAQEVMREGVKEYLLKPSKKEEIIRTVARVVREIRSERAEHQEFRNPIRKSDQVSPVEELVWQNEGVHGLIGEAKQYINDHFQESVTLEDTAIRVDLSPYYLSKLFKEINGVTFIEYLTEARINRAKELLGSTRMSQKEICFEVGYHDPNYFSRVFKKTTGRSPSHFRASITK